MARTFDGANDELRLSIGNCNITGAITMLAVVRRASTAYNGILGLHTSGGTATYSLELNDAGGAIDFSGDVDSGITLVNADGWALIGVNKAAGTSTARAHRYVYGTATWSHANYGSTLADQSSVSGGTVRLGEWQDADDFQGDIALAAIWNRSLTDAELETLPFSLNAYFALSPSGLWLLDQGATTISVADLTGGGARQDGTGGALTGTTVSTTAFPYFSYDAPVLMPTKVTAAGGLTETPDPIVLNVVLPAPTVTLSNAPAATVINLAITTPAHTLVAPTPDATVLNLTLPAPEPVRTEEPAATVLNVVQAAPSLALSNAPDAIVLNVTLPAPVVTLTQEPAAAVLNFTIVAPTEVYGLIESPDPIVLNVLQVAPAVTLSNAPAATVVQVTLPAPTTALSNAPDATVIQFATPAPTELLGNTQTPDPIVVAVTLVAPVVTLTQSPAATVLNVAMPDPTVLTGIVEFPDAIVIQATLPAPAVALSNAPAATVIQFATTTPAHTLAVPTPDPIVLNVVQVAPTLALSNSPDATTLTMALAAPSMTMGYTAQPVVLYFTLPEPDDGSVPSIVITGTLNVNSLAAGTLNVNSVVGGSV